ncbi:hypothetical protein SAMN02745245_01834 [Anaerosphaera aminiphila DSM 21120]|uniref:Cell shape-determining protein n=1 Tax=Anaerosphaera aminiphila DSM 21120 TaxID=1120995 RepID=A0A1M5UQ69_9FIRM|nr:hypothetical protein [Anaerosphaera aminiphila]SHH64988.1 hypothetical protein SAMN02745245_01834 [Anaerosphaera aminiphila DSM 21120]
MKNNIKSTRNIVLPILIGLIINFIIFYVVLPPINIFSLDFYVFLSIFTVIFYALFSIANRDKFLKVGKWLIKFLILIWAIFFIMELVSMIPFHAKKYANLINKEEGVFSEDVEQVDFDKLPVVDRSTALKLGSRKMGEMGDLVSQYDIDETYSQITVDGRPERVTPLVYSDLIKWFRNSKSGIPYYISVDMASQEVDLVKLEKPIRYSFTDKFSRDIKRHIRFRYPTALIDEINFEIDDDGHPFWIASTLKPTIGLIGGMDVNAVIVVDAITGETNKYKADNVPEWIDRVYSANLVIEQLNWNGKLKNGYINQYLGQKGVTKPTDGYNYLSIGNDIYLYTGITSVLADNSNIGFVLVNMRTKETKFYPVSSADEYSVMESAQGAVQEKGYKATFPILINLYNRPTYFMSLKDNADLTKMFAFVDAQNYQNVSTGSTLKQALASYDLTNLSSDSEIDESSLKDMTITVSEIQPVTIDGNTNYFIRAVDSDTVFIATIKSSNRLPFIKSGDVLEISGEDLGIQFNIKTIK